MNSAPLDAQAGTAICLQGTHSWLPRARYAPLIETRLTALFNFSFVNVCNGAASQRAPGAPDYSTAGKFATEALEKPDFRAPVPQSAVLHHKHQKTTPGTQRAGGGGQVRGPAHCAGGPAAGAGAGAVSSCPSRPSSSCARWRRGPQPGKFACRVLTPEEARCSSGAHHR